MSTLLAPRTVRLLVADDNAGIRHLIRATSARDPEMTVVAEAADGQAAIDLAMAHSPDVVLLDLEMPVMDGLAAIGPILTVSPATRIVMYSAQEARRDDALRAGAHAWITKGTRWTAMRTVLRDVSRDTLH